MGLKSLDILTEKPNFYVGESKILKSEFGACLSGLVLICTISISIYFGREIWEKKNPIVNYSKLNLDYPSEIVLDKNHFDFTFGLFLNNRFIIDPSIFSLNSYILTIVNNTFIEIPFEMEECTPDMLSPSNQGLYQPGLYCFPMNISHLSVKGVFGQEGFRLINFQLRTCHNNTATKQICKAEEEASRILAQAKFAVFVTDYSVTTNNYSEPYQTQIFNDFVTVSSNGYTLLNIFINHFSVISDVGFLFTSYDENAKFGVNNFKILYSFTPIDSGLFLELGVQLTNFASIYYRKYLKLQELMAQIGGIANLFIILSNVINYFPSRFNFRIYMINKIFTFNSSEANRKNLMEEQLNDASQYRSKDQALEFSKGAFYGVLSNNTKNSNNYLNPDLTRKPELKLKYSCLDAFLLCCYSSKKNYLRKMSDMGFKALKCYLSLENFVHVSREVERLKYLTYSANELELFNLLGNPFLEEPSRTSSYNYEFSKYSEFLNKRWMSTAQNPMIKPNFPVSQPAQPNSGPNLGDKIFKILF